LASKSFDSISSASSSTGGTNGSQDETVYDKLRLLNGGQPWANHTSAWYVPTSAAVAAAAAASTHPLMNVSSNISPGSFTNNMHNSIDTSVDCKKGNFESFIHYFLFIQLIGLNKSLHLLLNLISI
jgi:hypothetical protein